MLLHFNEPSPNCGNDRDAILSMFMNFLRYHQIITCPQERNAPGCDVETGNALTMLHCFLDSLLMQLTTMRRQ